KGCCKNQEKEWFGCSTSSAATSQTPPTRLECGLQGTPSPVYDERRGSKGRQTPRAGLYPSLGPGERQTGPQSPGRLSEDRESAMRYGQLHHPESAASHREPSQWGWHPYNNLIALHSWMNGGSSERPGGSSKRCSGTCSTTRPSASRSLPLFSIK